MRHRVIVFFITIAILAATYALLGNPYAPAQEQALVTKVVDGDTIVVEGGRSIRLLNIDTRERGKNCYSEAKTRLTELVLLKNVTLVADVEDEDRYNRLLRHVFMNGTHINLLMIEEGWAVAYIIEPNVAYADAIRQAEKDARSAGGCVWSQLP